MGKRKLVNYHENLVRPAQRINSNVTRSKYICFTSQRPVDVSSGTTSSVHTAAWTRLRNARELSIARVRFHLARQQTSPSTSYNCLDPLPRSMRSDKLSDRASKGWRLAERLHKQVSAADNFAPKWFTALVCDGCSGGDYRKKLHGKFDRMIKLIIGVFDGHLVYLVSGFKGNVAFCFCFFVFCFFFRSDCDEHLFPWW